MGKRRGKGKRSILAGLGLGVVSTLLFRLAFPATAIWPLAWIALAPLFFVLARSTPWRGAICAAPAGALMALISISGFRHLTWAAYIAPAVLGFLYYALAGAAISWATGRRGVPLMIAAPPIWTAYEFARSVIPVIKFPWLLAGQTQVSWTTIIQVADLGGVYLLTFIIALFNAYLAQAAISWGDRKRRRRTLTIGAIPLGIVAATFIYGTIRVRTIDVAPGPSIALVQGNIPQEIKLRGLGPRMFEEYLKLSGKCLSEKPALVVWPETMYPWPLHPDELKSLPANERRAYDNTRRILFEVARRGKTRLLIGALRTVDDDMRNSAYYISEKGEFLGRYDKIDLVPLGEMIPFDRAWPAFGRFVRSTFLPPGFGQLEPGEEIPLFDLEGRRFAVSICYEISFANLARRARSEGADFIVSISNDAWFKDGAELDLAKDQAVFRAVENRMGIARAANTGISSFVDPAGRSVILTRGGRRKQVEGILLRRIETSGNETLYTKLGDLFAWLTLIASVLILLPLNRLRPSRPPGPAPAKGKA